MKIGKNIKLFMILILFFVIIFVLLGHFNVFKEGLETPKCTNSEITDDDTENYYLSTELIPPICPTCPYYEPSNLTGHDEYHKYHDLSSDVSGGNGYISDKEKASYLDSIFGAGQNSNNSDSNNNNKNSNNTSVDTKNSNNTTVDSKTTQNVTNQSQLNKINTDNSTKNATNTNTNTDNSVTSTQVSQDSSVNQDSSQKTTTTSDSKFSNLLGNNSIMLGSFGGGGSGSNTLTQGGASGLMPVSSPESVNSSSLTPYDKVKTTDPETIAMINDMKTTINKLNQEASKNKEICPPCPACERCPDPAFECKKVPNYRSPSIDNYMPVPVLNDFSKF